MRLLIATAIIVAIAAAFRREIVEALLPGFQMIIEAVDDQFIILILDVTDRKLDQVVRLRVELARILVMNSHVTHPKPDAWLEVTTTLGTVLQPGLTTIITAAAWPAARMGEFVLRLLVSIMLAVLLTLLDAPIDLLAYVWGMFIFNFDPQGFYPIWKYHEFMIGGGRFAIGAVVGVVAIVGTARVIAAVERQLATRSWRALNTRS